MFAREGYQAATLNTIAHQAGVSRGAVHWHFKDKAGFFHETLQRLDGYYDELLQISSRKSGRTIDVIAESVAQVLRRFVHDQEFRSMQELVIRAALGHHIPLQLVKDEAKDRAIALLREAIPNDRSDDGISAEVAYTAIRAVVSGTFLMIIERGSYPTDQEIAQLAQFIPRGLAPCGTTRAVDAHAATPQE